MQQLRRKKQNVREYISYTQGIAPEAARRYAPADGISVQKSQRICPPVVWTAVRTSLMAGGG